MAMSNIDQPGRIIRAVGVGGQVVCAGKFGFQCQNIVQLIKYEGLLDDLFALEISWFVRSGTEIFRESTPCVVAERFVASDLKAILQGSLRQLAGWGVA
ncbi:hypothetical protein D3C84_891420 [compost metagenome]